MNNFTREDCISYDESFCEARDCCECEYYNDWFDEYEAYWIEKDREEEEEYYKNKENICTIYS